MLDFVQEMGDLKLALYGVGVTQTISSLVLICDAKTWSPKKRIKNVSDTGLFLCADRVLDFVQEVGDQGFDPLRNRCHSKKKNQRKDKNETHFS